MIRFIILAAAAWAAWHYLGWRWAVGVVVAYVLFTVVVNLASTLTRGVNASSGRARSASLMQRKLSDDEKTHYASAQDHQRAVADRQAHIDPELRRRSQP